MKDILTFQLKYLLFWTLFFLTGKLFFALYHIQPFLNIPVTTILQMFSKGILLDLSMSSYICLFPFTLIGLSYFLPHEWFSKITRIYSCILISLLSLIIVADVEIFTAWGSRLDFTIFRYLKNLDEAIASSLSSPILLLVGSWVLFNFLFIRFYDFHFSKKKDVSKSWKWAIPLSLITTAGLIIPIRGGLQLAPINESSVYFSDIHLANQGAMNVCWGFFHSVLESHDNVNPYVFFDPKKSEAITRDLYDDTCSSPPSLRMDRPNIIILLWESFTSKALKNYDGKTITPIFQEFIKEGIYFNNIYASGDRSDKGIVAVLSGYPAQTLHSIINNPYKSKKLPSLSTDLKKQGYATSFYYGGEPEFANIKSYLFEHDFEKLVSLNDFDKKERNSKWGAHDEFVLNRLYKDLNETQEPFFTTLFTLSSHEPFDIPMAPLLKPDSRENLFLNSLHYTDRCIGEFLEKAKKTSWWNNTLIIIIADHGHPLPGGFYADKGLEEFSIPMLWLGGAVHQKGSVITKTGSQTDLATTLLNQLKINPIQYKFSKDLLCESSPSFAYYAFNDGFGFIQDSSYVIYRNVSNTIGDQKGDTINILEKGKAYLQYSYDDYLNK